MAYQMLQSAKVVQCDETGDIGIFVNGEVWPVGGHYNKSATFTWDGTSSLDFEPIEFNSGMLYRVADLPEHISADTIRNNPYVCIDSGGGYESKAWKNSTPEYVSIQGREVIITFVDNLNVGRIFWRDEDIVLGKRGVYFLKWPSSPSYPETLTIGSRKPIDASYLPDSVPCAIYNMESGTVAANCVVVMSANNKVKNAASGHAPVGIAVRASYMDGDVKRVDVQFSGRVKVNHQDLDTLGYQTVVTNGSGGVRKPVDGEVGRPVIVLGLHTVTSSTGTMSKSVDLILL